MRAGFLLDANVLVAMAWPTHSAHAKAQQWFARHAREGWATCALTQTTFVRILSNPAFSPNALRPMDALGLLKANLEHPSHQFWDEQIGLVEAVQPFVERLVGHRQVTDAYLLGLAIHRKGKLVTSDRAILSLLPEKSPERETVSIL